MIKVRNNIKALRILFFAFIFFGLLFSVRADAYAGGITVPQITIGGTNEPAEVASAMQVMFLVSIIALAPSILLLMTGFTRIIISMHFLRAAMGTQQMPPNQVLVGVALILTLFMMGPRLVDLNENALQPFGRGEMNFEEALERGLAPIRDFMINETESRDLSLFADLAGDASFESVEEIPNSILIPAFVLGELTKGFLIGFIMYLPFIVIDMVVASVLMAMGMMMLPPAMISMPFKILLFLLAGGWSFFMEFIMRTFAI